MSFAVSTSLIRGICNDQDRWGAVAGEGNPYPSDEDHNPLGDMKIRGIYKPTSILPGQSNDIVVEDIERKAFSEGPFEIGLEEVVSPLVEIPSMIKLNAPQLGKVLRISLGAESKVGGGCCEDNKRAKYTSEEVDALAGDGIQDGGAGEGHGVVRKEGGYLVVSSERYPLRYDTGHSEGQAPSHGIPAE